MPTSRADEDSDGPSRLSATRSLLPLRLSAFESYMHVDDRPSHPMVFYIEIEVSGDLQVEAMQTATANALRQHPLLTARVARRMRGRCWVPAATTPRIEVVSGAGLLSSDLSPINLRREPGCRIWIVPSQAGGRILFGFHHAATDGLGAMQFIGDVFVAYAHRTAADDQELPAPRLVDPDSLRSRACLKSPNVAPGQTPLSRARVFFRQLGTSASRLATASSTAHLPGSSQQTMPPFVSRTMDREFLKEIKQAAARRMLHLNDLYVATLFKSIFDWNRRHGEADDQRLIRLSLPTSLRTPQHDLCPAANVVNMVFLNRREADCGDIGVLLDRAGELMNASTHDRVFFRAMRWARCLPGLMELGSRLPYNFATMVLTNVGDVKRQFGTRFPLSRGRCVAGSVTIEALRGTSPLRPGTHVGVSVGTYASQLFANAICDPHLYSREDAEAFLDLFLSELGALAAPGTVRVAA